MTPPYLQATRDVIIRTDAWQDAITFYESVLGLPIVHRSADLIGFEMGSFRLYVEKGRHHGPVFELLVPDVESTKQRLLAAGCVLQEEDASVPRCYLRDPVGLAFNLRPADSAT